MRGFQRFSDYDLKRFTRTELRYDVQQPRRWPTDSAKLFFGGLGANRLQQCELWKLFNSSYIPPHAVVSPAY